MARRGYAVLASMSILLSVLVLLVCLKLVSENHSKICSLLGIIASKQIDKPDHPGQHPELYAEYIRHQAYVQLAKECH